MNLEALLEHGHQIFLRSFEGLSELELESEKVTGGWTAREVFAHLATMEQYTVEVMGTFLGQGPTPILDGMKTQGGDYLDTRARELAGKPLPEILALYQAAYEQVMAQINRVPEEIMSRRGTLPWYGEIYALDDFIVYTEYAHKREHSAQLEEYKARLKKAG